jgi:predicted TIM-barrel fold metal-dependent hydrolase
MDGDLRPARAKLGEAPVDPKRRIIDAHHHLWGDGSPLSGAPPYLIEDLLADLGGHNVVGTVYAECGSAYRTDGPEALRPVGETEFAVAQSKISAGSRAPMLGIVSYADLSLGDAVQQVLDAHAEAGAGLFRGIRQIASYTPGVSRHDGSPPRDLFAEDAFHEGLRRMGAGGYAFDTLIMHTQLPDVARHMQALPGTTFVLNHLGMPMHQGPRSGREAVMAVWRDGMRAAAASPNVFVKVGGIGMDPMFGMGWSKLPEPPSSDVVVDWWGDDLRFCIDTFGPDRCIFESNFPVDGWTLPYTTLWNALQKVAARYTDAEQDALFAGTAKRVYRLETDAV